MRRRRGIGRTKPVRRPKLDGFTGIVDAILEADTDPDVPRKQRHTAHRIFERLRDEHGFSGGYTIAAALYVERLIDRLMTDPHRLILGPVPRIVDPKTVRDLLRTPGPGPSPALPRPMPTTVPDDAWPLDHRSIRCRDPTRKPILHIAPQRLIRCQLGWLRPFGGSISMPLRRRCSVVQATASGRRVAPHLAGDRRRCSLQPASNMTYASSLGAQKSNLLTFLERQVTS